MKLPLPVMGVAALMAMSVSANLNLPANAQSRSVIGRKVIKARVKRAFNLRNILGDVGIKYNQQPWRRAQAGNQLTSVGEQVRTGRRSRVDLQLDVGIGTIQVAPQSLIQIRGMTVNPDQSRVSLFAMPYGSARLKLRRFTNPNTRFEINTPAGISGVRGTEYGISVQPNGKTSVAVLEGRVNTAAQGADVDVDGGFQNFTIPGEPPSQPVPLSNDTSFSYTLERTIDRMRRRLVVVGAVDPVNVVSVNGKVVSTDRQGKFRVPLGSVNFPRLQVLVQTPLGEARRYNLRVRL